MLFIFLFSKGDDVKSYNSEGSGVRQLVQLCSTEARVLQGWLPGKSPLQEADLHQAPRL